MIRWDKVIEGIGLRITPDMIAALKCDRPFVHYMDARYEANKASDKSRERGE
jgi:hypothetical protein